jgi:hypothetical protein
MADSGDSTIIRELISLVLMALTGGGGILSLARRLKRVEQARPEGSGKLAADVTKLAADVNKLAGDGRALEVTVDDLRVRLHEHIDEDRAEFAAVHGSLKEIQKDANEAKVAAAVVSVKVDTIAANMASKVETGRIEAGIADLRDALRGRRRPPSQLPPETSSDLDLKSGKFRIRPEEGAE